MEKLNDFEALEDLHKDFEVLNDKEKKWILVYKFMHPGSRIVLDKHMEEQNLQ